MELRALIDEYRNVHLAALNRAPKTRDSYARDLGDLVNYLDGVGIAALDRIGLKTLEGYLAHLDRRELAGTTRRRRTYAIKSFFNFLKKAGYIDRDIALELIRPDAAEHAPRVLSEDEYWRLRLAVMYHARDAAIVELLLQTGIRLGELARLTRDDITVPKKPSREADNVGVVDIAMGKGRKPRPIALNFLACQALNAYLQVRPDADTRALFLSKYKKAMQPRAYEQLVEKYLKKADIKNASVHTLRHTCATHLVKNGANLRTVQEMLGHSDLKATSRYISLAREQMNKDVQAHGLK